MRNLRLSLWPSSRVVWALAAIAFLLALSPGISILAPLSAVLLAALIVAMLVDALALPQPRLLGIHRTVPAHFALRRVATLQYEVENRSSRSLRVGFVEEPLHVLELPRDEIVALVPAQALVPVTADALPVARGSGRFSRIYFWYETQLGLLRRRARIEAPEPIRVYPDLSAVERYGNLTLRNRLIEAGLRRMRMRGEGSEFESLRDYAAGDAFRAIDWKATARRGKLMVVQREVERSQDVMLMLDCGRLMTARIGEQRKLDYAVTAALSVASIASLASDRVGVVAFAREILLARSPRSTASSMHALADALSDVEPRFEESDYARAINYVRSHLHRRSLVVLFTDVIDPVAQSTVLAELSTLAKRHVVLCAFMNDAAVAQTLAATPHTIDDAYRLDVALGLEHERTVAAKTLERAGVIVLDAPAAKLSVATIDEYLRIKSR
ncbi:MAG: DUF58 domain-containing protein [Candidatus Eremiobacteraeota bacterium]|nr:DUF58 domain-containing protein [Candidatus Eremiobacteraeota bacterium]